MATPPMTRLPRALDELAGLRAARWIRESTAGQADRYGPDAQREQQDQALERYGLVDVGLAWQVAHSGRTIAASADFGRMLAAAGREYDVLLVGYVSRFARDLRTAVNARHELHAAGAALLFCDERVLSSDEDAWEQWAREAVEAEAYSRRLGKRIREGYAAKFRRLADPAGAAPLGFHRIPPASTLAIDPDTIGNVVRVFERYASGIVSYQQLGDELGIEAGSVRELLRNPIYNGWVRRHRRAANEERQPAAWREHPPVSDELWERVQAIKHRRTHSSGPRSTARPASMLAGLMHCACGARLRWNGTNGSPPRPILIHPPGDCTAWGQRRTYPVGWYEDAIAAQITGLRLDDRTISRVVAAVSSPAPRPSRTTKTRIERRRRELALEHAANRLTDVQYLDAVVALRAERAIEVPEPIVAAEVVEQLRALPETFASSTPERRRGLVAAIYDQLVVVGLSFVSARLTPSAEAHGLAIALPPSIELVSREGAGLTRTIVSIPIEGRREWLAVTKRSA